MEVSADLHVIRKGSYSTTNNSIIAARCQRTCDYQIEGLLVATVELEAAAISLVLGEDLGAADEDALVGFHYLAAEERHKALGGNLAVHTVH